MLRTVLIVCALSTSALAGTKVVTKTTALYPSKKCKDKIPAADGSDPVLTCPSAVKGYEVEVSFSAVDTHVIVQGDGKTTSFSGFVGNKLEWRLVDGKPVALIVELGDHDLEAASKVTNRRVVVLPWGSSTPKVELPLGPKLSAKKQWAAARVAADS